MDLPAFHPFRSEEARAEYLVLYDERAKMWPIPSEERTVETSFGSTFLRISGPKDAPPLVLLPMAGSTSLMWAPNIEALSKQHRTYALDNIMDNGRSVYARPVQDGHTFAEWLDGLFDGLGLKKGVNLMGLSFGGWIASQYALRHPGRIGKLVLLAPAATVLPLGSAFLFRISLSGRHPLFHRSMMFWLSADWAKQDAYGRRMVEQSVNDLLVAARCYLPRPMVPLTVLSDSEWQSLKMPTLFLVGANEKIYSPKKAIARLKAVAPQIRIEIIPGAGHDLSLVQAELVNRKVLEFLSQK